MKIINLAAGKFIHALVDTHTIKLKLEELEKSLTT